MDKVGLFHFVAEPYLLDFRGRVTLPMIGNYLIHAASSHAGERGFGFDAMSERHTAWVLSRLAIEMREYPTAFERIDLYTWIDEVGRLFTSRCFELTDGKGKTFGFARSVWAAIDMETRRPTLLDAEAVKVISASPKWRPARVNGQKVSCSMTLPVEFRLEKKSKGGGFGINGRRQSW